MRQRVEVRDGREFIVVVLPQDKRLEPKRTRKRAYWAALTEPQKREFIERRKQAAKKRRRTRKR